MCSTGMWRNKWWAVCTGKEFREYDGSQYVRSPSQGKIWTTTAQTRLPLTVPHMLQPLTPDRRWRTSAALDASEEKGHRPRTGHFQHRVQQQRAEGKLCQPPRITKGKKKQLQWIVGRTESALKDYDLWGKSPDKMNLYYRLPQGLHITALQEISERKWKFYSQNSGQSQGGCGVTHTQHSKLLSGCFQPCRGCREAE